MALRSQLSHKLLLISERAFAGDHFKVFVETGEVIEATFIAELFNTEVILYKEFAGMTNTQLDKELGIRFPGS